MIRSVFRVFRIYNFGHGYTKGFHVLIKKSKLSIQIEKLQSPVSNLACTFGWHPLSIGFGGFLLHLFNILLPSSSILE